MKKDSKIIVSLLVIAVLVVAVAFYVSTSLPPKTTDVSHTSGLSMTSTNEGTMVITYANGQTQTVTSIEAPSTKPLSIIGPSGSSAASINTNLYMYPVYTGTVASYTIAQGMFGVEIVTGAVSSLAQLAASTEVYSTSLPLTPTSQPTMPPSGGSVIVCSSTVTASAGNVPFAGVNYVAGQTYTLVDSISAFSISGTFTDGSPFGPVIAGTAYYFWTFQYHSDNSFTSVSVGFALSAR